MNIHQLSVSFDERQDRLLLRLSTQAHEEFRFWLTRRMTSRLLPTLEKCVVRLEASQPGVAAPDPGSQQMLSELKRDAFMQKADFSTPFASQTPVLPLGSEPLLVTDAHFNLESGGALRIQLLEKSPDVTDKSCQMNLQAALVHGLVHLIRQALGQTGWAMGLEAAADVQSTAPEESSEPTTRYAH